MALSNAFQIATDFIAGEESFSGTAYWDVNGYAIGYGNHYYSDGSAVKQGDTISQADAYTLLQFYVQQFYYSQVAPKLTVPQSDNQIAGLISLAYNCGSDPSALISLINSRASSDAIDTEWENVCVTAGGVYSNVLYNRRGDEIGLYDTISSYVQANPGTSVAIAVAGFAIIGLTAYYFIRISKK